MKTKKVIGHELRLNGSSVLNSPIIGAMLIIHTDDGIYETDMLVRRTDRVTDHGQIMKYPKCSFCGKLFKVKIIPGPPEPPPICCDDEECRRERVRWFSRIVG